MAQCIECSQTIIDTANFCPKCGANQLVGRKAHEIRSTKNTDKNTNNLSNRGNKFLAVALLLICVGAAVYFIGSKKSQSFIDACVQYRVNEFRQNFGDNQLITFDMLEWWKAECKK